MNATIRSAQQLTPFFSPSSVAVIGASRRRGTIGGDLFHNLLEYQFTGPVYPVNTEASSVQGVAAYRSVEEIPGAVDLALVAVPAAAVQQVAQQCIRKGVKAMVVISAGFAEVGEEGKRRQLELLRLCRNAAVPMLGPNCLGIASTDPNVRLNATFAPHPPPRGRTAFLTQSGALGLAMIDYASTRGLGISAFVSYGNKADVSANDLLEHWEGDPDTDLVLLYLESFGNPRKFSRIARRVGARKPIVALKSGRSLGGRRAAASHTGALLAESDITVDALCNKAGIIRTDSFEELCDVAALLAHQRLPEGNRVAIVTNAGGPGIMCADACETSGLILPELSAGTQTRLRPLVAKEASLRNPVDLLADADEALYERAISIVGGDEDIDAMIVVFTPPLAGGVEGVGRAILRGISALDRKIPVANVFMSAQGPPPALCAPAGGCPTYQFPESAARALGHAVKYAKWRGSVEEATPPGGIDRAGAEAVLRQAGETNRWLSHDETAALLRAYGLPLAKSYAVRDARHAAGEAERIGGTVALKAAIAEHPHKTDLGAVALNLTADGVGRAMDEMEQRLRERGLEPEGFFLQSMVHGVEILVGAVQDRHFGPVVTCGAGGVLTELLKDFQIGLPPLSVSDVKRMVTSLRCSPMLTGFRGGRRSDVAALEDVILRVGCLIDDLPLVRELDCNPVIVADEGATVVDARVFVGTW